MRRGNHDNGESYKDRAITAAKELCYGPKVIEKIKNAETDVEVERIMYDARHGRR